MLKASIKFFGVILTIAVIAALFVYERQIQQLLPFFRADVVLSGILLIAGCTLSIFIRHLGIFAATLVMVFAIPFLVRWIVQYWPYIANHYFN
jgi:hypothetical protein